MSSAAALVLSLSAVEGLFAMAIKKRDRDSKISTARRKLRVYISGNKLQDFF
jgi:hypothetical protein